jgi:hypothetical protein
MSIPSDYKDLLISLSDRTDKGRVKWKFDGHAAEVLIDDNRLSLWAGTDERTDDAFVSFALKDLAGNIIDTWYLDAADEHFDFMNRFYLSAKRQALGIPNRLAKLRSSIEGSDIIGKE